MRVDARKQIVFDVDEEQKEFLNEIKDFCLHVKVRFKETDYVYRTMEDMEAFISDMRQGKPFETHK